MRWKKEEGREGEVEEASDVDERTATR